MREDEAAAALAALRKRRETTRRRSTWRGSRLVRFRAEVVALHRAGGSLAEICALLRKKHRCVVARSTVLRFLKTLPEASDGAST